MKTQIYCITTVLALSIGTLYAQKGYVDDLYRKPGQNEIVVKKEKPVKTVRSTTNNAEESELVESYDEALQRRIDAYLSSDKMPKEFWDVQQKYVELLAKKYDETFFNIIVINDRAWVEPRYITSMFDESDPVGDLSKYAYKGTSTVVNVNVDVIDPWRASWYSPWSWRNLSWGWNSPYWGGGYYSPYWGGGYYPPYWGGGYYPPYWGGGYYPPYWGGGYYPPHWGGGHFPSYPVHNYDSRPRYYGGNYYSGGNRPSSGYRPGSGFGRPVSAQNRPAYSPSTTVNNQTNVRRYNNANTRPGSSVTLTRPSNNTRPTYERPSTNRYEQTTRPAYESRPTREVPTYSPPRSTGGGEVMRGTGGGGGGGFGGGSRRTR